MITSIYITLKEVVAREECPTITENQSQTEVLCWDVDKGGRFPPGGCCVQDQAATLPLLVIVRDGPSLLGRDWLKHFKLDWSQLNSVTLDQKAGV